MDIRYTKFGTSIGSYMGKTVYVDNVDFDTYSEKYYDAYIVIPNAAKGSSYAIDEYSRPHAMVRTKDMVIMGWVTNGGNVEDECEPVGFNTYLQDKRLNKKREKTRQHEMEERVAAAGFKKSARLESAEEQRDWESNLLLEEAIKRADEIFTSIVNG